MQTLQAAASALFRQLIKPDPVQDNDEQAGSYILLMLFLSVLDQSHSSPVASCLATQGNLPINGECCCQTCAASFPP